MTFRDLYARYDDDEHMTRRLVRRDRLRRSSLISILWRRKLTILAVIALCLLGGVIYIVVTPTRYLASTSMLIDPRLGKSVGSDPVQPGFIVDASAMDSQIKLFTSQTVLSRVAKMANLKDDSEFNGTNRSLWQMLTHPSAELDDGVDLKSLEKAITIKRPERTYVVGIDVLSKSPKLSAEIANDLTQAYIDDQISARIDAARDDTRFVRQQLSALSSQIKDAEDKVEAFKTQNNVVDTNGLRSNEQQVTDLTKALGEARARTSDTKAKLDEIQRMRTVGRLDAANDAVKSLTIERLRQQQAETSQNVARLAATLGSRHPELQEAEGREVRIEKLIRDELDRLVLAANGDYLRARRNEEQIVAEVESLKGKSTKISRDLVPLEQLERNVAVLRASFDRFAQIRDNLSQQEADSPPGRVIAVARPPVSSAQPKKTIVALASAAAGVFFGLATALFAEGASASAGEPTAPPEGGLPPIAAAAPPPSLPRRYWDDDDAPT